MNRLNDQQRKLALWLKEWELDRNLEHSAPIPNVSLGNKAGAEQSCSDTSTPATIRQIRLLHPAGETSRPIYVALLDERKEGFLVAPFGRFSSPALPGELSTGLAPLPLRVLCIWNHRTLAPDVIRNSWKAGTITAALHRKALKILNLVMQGKSAEDANTGPELRHPLDPRHEYAAEEACLLDDWAASISRTGLESGATTVYPGIDPDLRLAAEPKIRYGEKSQRPDETN